MSELQETGEPITLKASTLICVIIFLSLQEEADVSHEKLKRSMLLLLFLLMLIIVSA